MKRKKKKKKTSEFAVAEGWPSGRPLAKAKAQAVQALVANHTLIVGQSRSGKTTAVRRLIEEILTWTGTRVVILDPNADFKWLNELKPSLDSSERQFGVRWRKIRQRIGIATPGGAAWGIDWSKLSLVEMAAFLRLKPTENFAEYRQLDRHLKYEKQTKRLGTLQTFAESPYFEIAVGEELERYRLQLQELSTLNVWATDAQRDLDSLFQDEYKAIVVDLSIDDEQVRMITAARTLEALWEQAEKKRIEFLQNGDDHWVGTLVVIDEGHLFAPPKPEDPQKQLVCERIQRFADQGKKLNLYLMIVTQQPGKLHPDVLSEFSNRIILRVNERRSLTALEKTYGGIEGRYDGALTFEKKGEALVEGSLLCDESPPPSAPRAVRFKEARTREGGGTPKADWALPKLG